jgi:hypothetical protein
MHLSSSEAHAWADDTNGKIYDATPPLRGDSKDAKHFEENYAEHFKTPEEKKDEKQKIIYLLGAITAAGLGVAGKRKIGAFSRSIRHNHIAPLSGRESQLAYDLINQAIYSQASIDDERFGRALERSGKRERGGDQRWRNFAARHDPEQVKAFVKIKAKDSNSPEVRRALKRAQSLHRHYHANVK